MTASILDRTAPVSEAGIAEPAQRASRDLLPCRSNNPELWFAESPTEIEAAKALCVACPLQSICLSGALERREPWGVWGGELFVRGVVIARKRPRGRPRKNATVAA